MTTLTIAAALVLSPGAVHAQSTLYKVVDEYGNVTYQDQPPVEDAGVKSESLTVQAPTPEAPAAAAGNRDSILAAAQTRPLVLFTVPECETCDFLRWFLDERELPYEEVDVGNNVENQQRLRQATGEYRVPVLMVGEEPQFGYDRDALMNELAEAGYVDPESPPSAPAEGDLAPDPDSQRYASDADDPDPQAQ